MGRYQMARNTEDLSLANGKGKLRSVSASDDFNLSVSAGQVRFSMFNYMLYCPHGLTISHRYCFINCASGFLGKHILAVNGRYLTPQAVTPEPNCATIQYHGMAI